MRWVFGHSGGIYARDAALSLLAWAELDADPGISERAAHTRSQRTRFTSVPAASVVPVSTPLMMATSSTGMLDGYRE